MRGEDVLTQVTHALVCLLRVRPGLSEHLGALGYVPKLLALLSASVGRPARYNLGVQALRVVQTTAGCKGCVQAAARGNVVGVLLRVLTPLPRDTAFALETLKALLETDTADSHALVEACVRQDGLVGFLVHVLEGAKLEGLVDPSAAKVHAVAILKLLEADALHGPAASGALGAHRDAWERYRHQKHDLFLSKNDTRDYFLTDAAGPPTFMLKNTAEWAGAANSAPAEPPTLWGAAPHAAGAGGGAPDRKSVV